jgi:hypothetical protein
MKIAERRPLPGAGPALLAALALGGPPGCARSEGGFLATLVPGALSARLSTQPGAGTARFTSDGWLRTDLGYALSLHSLRLHASEISLWGTPRGQGAGPGSPGSPGSPVSIVSLHPAGPVPVSVPGSASAGSARVPLSTCTPGCGLSAGTLRLARLTLTGVSAKGEARDETGAGRVPAGTPFSFSLDLEADPRGAVLIEAALDLTLTWTTPERLLPDAALSVPTALLDGIDLATDSTGARLRENLPASALRIELSGVSE